MSLDDSLIIAAISRSDHFRRRLATEPTSGFREWQHFCILGEGIDLLVNFSVTDHSARGPTVARVTALARTGQWCGGMARSAWREHEVRLGRLDARFGGSRVLFQDGEYHVKVALDEAGIDLDARLLPVSVPFTLPAIEIGESPPLGWLVVPRLIASGRASIHGAVHVLDGAQAYHDHNWGCWGDDLAWEWGFALPRDPTNPHSLVFVHLSNRARTYVITQAVLLWEGSSLRRVARDRALRFHREGLLRPRRLCKIPPVMGLLAPGTLTDAPRRLTITLDSEGDRAVGCFDAKDVAQVIVPNDHRPELTIINEIAAEVHFEGVVRGQTICLEGRGVFESLSV